jgi:hypothetical protein
MREMYRLVQRFIKCSMEKSDKAWCLLRHSPIIMHYQDDFEAILRDYPSYEYLDLGKDKLVLKYKDETTVLKIALNFPEELQYMPYRLNHILYPLYVTHYNDVWISTYPYVHEDIPVTASQYSNDMKLVIQEFTSYGIANCDPMLWNYRYYKDKLVCIDFELMFIHTFREPLINKQYQVIC